MAETIVLILLVLFALGAALVFGVDFLFYLKDRYCRFHIGRWPDPAAWQRKVEDRAVRWLLHTPTVKITDNCRYMLLDFLTGRYRSHTIQSWQKGALLLAMLESGRPELARRARQAAASLLDGAGDWKVPPAAVDCGLLSCAVLLACGPQAARPALERAAAVIEGQRHESGMLCYTRGNTSPDMYVDTLGLACPFLVLWGKTCGRPELEEMAVFQLETFHRYGMLPGTALPNHAFHIGTKLPLGVYGWGRGTGWYVIGLLDTYRNVTDPAHRERLRALLLEAAEDYRRFQRPDGGFGSTLQRMDTYDSSATAVLAWFYLSCGEIFGREDYEEIGGRCLDKLRGVTRITGAIDWCQGDTKGIGIFAQTYDIMPFAQGMALRALYQQDRILRRRAGAGTGEAHG